MRTETCGRCGEEVRYGVRPSPARTPADQATPYWMHRTIEADADHTVIFGEGWTPELQAKLDASLVEMAARGKVDKKKKGDALPEPEEEPDVWAEVPEPEVRSHPITIDDLVPGSGIMQVYKLATGKSKHKVTGWEVRRLTASRGPYVGARGQVLSISDSIVMGMRGPTLDTGTQIAVASWRDGKFDFAYTGYLRGETVYTQAANATALKAFIRGE